MADKKSKKSGAIKSHLGKHWGKYSWLPLLYEGAKWSWGGKEGGRAGFKHGSRGPNPKRPKGGWTS